MSISRLPGAQTVRRGEVQAGEGLLCGYNLAGRVFLSVNSQVREPSLLYTSISRVVSGSGITLVAIARPERPLQISPGQSGKATAVERRPG